jgi:Protein kinase domain
MMPRACPTVDDYHQLVLGLLPDSVAAELEKHLLECVSCVETARRVATDSRLVGALQAQAEPSPLEEQKQIDTLILRMLAQGFCGEGAATTRGEKGVGVLQHAPQETCGPLASGEIPGNAILNELGRGGQSVVWQARQLSLNRLVALKMILARAAADPEERARFRREAEAVAHLKHPNIVQIHDVGEQAGQPYFALEVCRRRHAGAKTCRYAAARPADSPVG